MFHNHHNGKLNRYKIRFRDYINTKNSFLEVKFKTNKGETIKSRQEIMYKSREFNLGNNKFIEEMSGKRIFPFPIQNTITTPLRRVSQKKNNGEFINLWAGINFNKVRNLPAKELMKKLSEEFRAEI